MLDDVAVSNAIQRLSDGLRQARMRQGLTMDQLAARSGVNKSTLSRIENNLTAPSTESLLRLTYALGVSVESLSGIVPSIEPAGETAGSEASPTIEDETAREGENAGDHGTQSSQRAGSFRRLNFITRPSLTASLVRVTRSTNVPRIATRKRIEEHLIGLEGSVDVQYDGGLVQRLNEGEVLGLISRQLSYKLKLCSSEPAILIKIGVPILRDRLKGLPSVDA